MFWKFNFKVYLFGKFWSFDFDKSCADSFHVRLKVVEDHSTRTDGILVLVCVDASINNTFEQILKDVGNSFGTQHTMQSPNKDSLAGIQVGRRTTDKGRVRNCPRDHLYFLVSHSLRRDFEVPKKWGKDAFLSNLYKIRGWITMIQHHFQNLGCRWTISAWLDVHDRI